MRIRERLLDIGSLGVIANGCTECNNGRDVRHESLGKIVDDFDDLFADDGLGNSEYAVRSSEGSRSECGTTTVLAVGDELLRNDERRVKIDLIASDVDYLKQVTSAIATKVAIVPIKLSYMFSIVTSESDHRKVWRNPREHFERAIGVSFCLNAGKGLGGAD